MQNRTHKICIYKENETKVSNLAICRTSGGGQLNGNPIITFNASNLKNASSLHSSILCHLPQPVFSNPNSC